jgi:hypothetical protein
MSMCFFALTVRHDKLSYLQSSTHANRISLRHVKSAIHSQLNCVILLCDVIPDGKTEQTAQFSQAIV